MLLLIRVRSERAVDPPEPRGRLLVVLQRLPYRLRRTQTLLGPILDTISRKGGAQQGAVRQLPGRIPGQLRAQPRIRSTDSKPPHWTKFTKRPIREYQLSSSQSGRAWSTLSSNAGIRDEQPITQNGSAVVTTSSSLGLPSLSVTKEPILTREEAPEDSLEGESDSESEAGEEYKDPLSESSGRYW